MINADGTIVVGKRGRSGRKTKAKEIQDAIENITSEALIKLANSKVYKHLNTELDFVKTKEMALPVALRGITEKKEVEFKPMKINVIRPEPFGTIQEGDNPTQQGIENLGL